MTTKDTIIKDLLAIEAVQINPKHWFTWTSGIKSPIYCDNRLTMSYPEIRKKITQCFVDMLQEVDWHPDVIAGCATAGIPHAAWLADALSLPLVYVRSEAKQHGKGKQIEGKVEQGQKVLVIEDLISTGSSSIKVAQCLQQEGLHVLGVFAIFTYGLEKAKQNFAATDIPYMAISNFDLLLELLQTDGKLTIDERKELLGWRQNL
ncbi:orotate phosphoribosyltransferase [Virgibacillus sp. 179-BFC.A HS]|uniref:Orotate phosphoribosyltransferase n=1 Tax=Tigheibacillus jepli TaxID=3035914 RepID=A0ABU5CJB2_9BACI|nr:orotate phosphoribosyltransferase [Virgibacillus sp. 179-BFC.A HS]MDY0405942.1 orotate phosphoribosyltransferase [Virgibacillus sp. 179-BFC.A HS]